MSSAEDRLARWLASTDFEAEGIIPHAGDVSRRQYFRLDLARGTSAIGVVYPRDMQPVCRRFVASTALLQSVDVRVPEILLADCDRGLMLVQDLGQSSLYDLAARPWSELQGQLEVACRYIRQIQTLHPAAVVDLDNPPLDAQLLRQEIDVSWQALLPRPELAAPVSLIDDLERALGRTCAALAASPLVPCHRDFMARNLMLPDLTEPPVVIDHQDLRLGPAHYDLASLLNDSLFPPDAVEHQLRSAAAGDADSLRLYRHCAIQRTVKAAGTFARFAELGDARHVPLILPSLGRTATHLGALPSTRELGQALAAFVAKRVDDLGSSRR